MTLAPGTRLGPYEIVAFVAAGGMGEVYRARDTRLGRIVAVKIVGSALAHDTDTRRRFEDEARLAAQLDHPRIGAVYDVGRYGDIDYFVMEFIDGESLAQRLAAGPLRMRELIGVAIEIASALACAHGRGVMHGDLKPGNILLTSNGVKVVDFGLGALHHGRTPSDRIAALETAPLPKTDAHVVMGTAGFLPPERLQGLDADHRADIFAFGAVLYEMASGRRAFEGRSAADVIAAILTADPPALPGAPAEMTDVDWIIRRCIRKRPDDRWQSMADVETVLRRIAGGQSWQAGAAPPRWDARAWAAAVMAAVVLIGAGALAFRSNRDDSTRAPLVALTIPPPPGSGFTPTEGSVQSPQFAVSPDGRSIAFVASGSDGMPEIWIRPIDSTSVRPLPGTAHATYPFWSPSSRSIGFFADGDLKRIDLDGGPARVLASAPNGRGGAWNVDDVILFSPDVADAIRKVTGTGEVVEQTAFSKAHHDISHRWPQFLPDGRHFIYFARSADDRTSSIHLASVDSREDRVVIQSGIGAAYADGHLLYVEDDALLAARLDVARARVAGDPVPIVDHVATSSNFYGAFSAAAGGVLAYATKASAAELMWVGRDGRRMATVARGAFVDFRLSPDQRYLAVAAVEPRSGRADLRLLDLVRGTDVRLTMSPATDASPVFSPDGSRLAFRSNRERVHDLYLRPAGPGDDQIFLRSSSAKSPTDWTRDGTFIVYHANDEHTHHDVWAAPVEHPDQAQPLVRTEFDDIQGQVSPSGRWLAYVSNQSSRFEVYVQPLHDASRRWQISTSGGSDPKWRADEREIFYVARDERLMAVELGAAGEIQPGTPHALFPLHDAAVLAPFPSGFDVQPDGQRFLIRERIDELQTLPLTVLVNWSPLVRSRAPAR